MVDDDGRSAAGLAGFGKNFLAHFHIWMSGGDEPVEGMAVAAAGAGAVEAWTTASPTWRGVEVDLASIATVPPSAGGWGLERL